MISTSKNNAVGIEFLLFTVYWYSNLSTIMGNVSNDSALMVCAHFWKICFSSVNAESQTWATLHLCVHAHSHTQTLPDSAEGNYEFKPRDLWDTGSFFVPCLFNIYYRRSLPVTGRLIATTAIHIKMTPLKICMHFLRD